MNVWIIGASSGIGKEVAHVFSKKGWDVICSSRDENELHRLAGDLTTRYRGNAYVYPIDLENSSDISLYVEEVYNKHVNIDCVVVTAGTLPRNEEEYYNEVELLRVVRINYTGIASLLNGVSRRMVAKQNGIIICLSSVAGERGRRKNFIYGASKSALTAYLQGLRAKVFNDGVRVITVLPGYVDTVMAYGKVKKGLAASPKYVAEKIYMLLKQKKDVTYIPPIWWLIMAVVKLIPESIFKRLRFEV